MASRADSSSREPTKAVGWLRVSELTLTMGTPASRARSTAGELASTSHGLRMIASTPRAMKLSTCRTWRSGLRCASLMISFTPSSRARSVRALSSMTMNSEERFIRETPTTGCLAPRSAGEGVSRRQPVSNARQASPANAAFRARAPSEDRLATLRMPAV